MITKFLRSRQIETKVFLINPISFEENLIWSDNGTSFSCSFSVIQQSLFDNSQWLNWLTAPGSQTFQNAVSFLKSSYNLGLFCKI